MILEILKNNKDEIITGITITLSALILYGSIVIISRIVKQKIISNTKMQKLERNSTILSPFPIAKSSRGYIYEPTVTP
jgi:hypothetical protein